MSPSLLIGLAAFWITYDLLKQHQLRADLKEQKRRNATLIRSIGRLSRAIERKNNES